MGFYQVLQYKNNKTLKINMKVCFGSLETIFDAVFVCFVVKEVFSEDETW